MTHVSNLGANRYTAQKAYTQKLLTNRYFFREYVGLIVWIIELN